jgi:hypothetical protein
VSRALHAAALGSALAAALAGLGCATSLDLGRAREAIESGGPEPAPALSDAPNAALAAVAELRSVSGELRAIPLRWEASREREVAGYVVERAPNADGPFAYVATLPDRFRTVYVDRGMDLAPKRDAKRAGGGLAHGDTYYYRVRPFDAAGRVGSAAARVVSGTTAQPPAPPAGVQAYSQLPRRAALRWEPANDPHVTGYVVSRSPSASGTYATVARIEGRHQTVFVDDRLPDLGVFYYRVASVDAAGAVGDPSGAERAVTKPEPLPPAGLRVGAQSVGVNELVWEENVEPDVVSYRLVRRFAGAADFESVSRVEAPERRARDAAAVPGERATYVLFAIDADGLRSAASDPLEVVGVDYGLQAAAESAGVRLRWNPSAQSEFAETRVLLAGGMGAGREVGRSTSAEFLHTGAEPGARLRYQLIGVRRDGSEAPASAIVEARVPE